MSTTMDSNGSDDLELNIQQLYEELETELTNLQQGDVEILDGEIHSDAVRIEIDKYGPTDLVLDGIITNQAMYDIGRGMVYVLQVDYVETDVGLGSVIGGSVIGVLSLFVLAVLLICWNHKRRRDAALTASSAQDAPAVGNIETTASSTTTLPAEPVVNTPENVVTKVSTGVNARLNHTPRSPPPPPLRRTENIYSTQPKSPTSPSRKSQGSPRSLGSPSRGTGMSKTTLATMSIVTAISLVYAGCSTQPRVRILVFIPHTVILENIQLFFSMEFSGHVYTDRWSHRNLTKLAVYDVEDASMTKSLPCTAEALCPSAYNQNLAGCDAATRTCVCERGYIMDNGICVDLDECASGLDTCPQTATCQNTIGSYICRCGYGYYTSEGTCKACHVGCPADTYESNACTNSHDRKCTACTPCKGSMYEARPCKGTVDRQCMHVAHPLLITGQEAAPTYLEELRVDASINVFLENLHATRNLETTYYVTDNTQATDFFWVRESGLQVHIGIHDVQLIPEYEDIDHESDNLYILKSPPTSEDITKFRKILRNYCRHPIPEYYSITVEIARDRITTADKVTCNSQDPSTLKCPKDYTDGEKYLHRTINEACQKMGTFPDPLTPAVNSIVCTKNTELLRTIFNQTYTLERPINFPSRACRSQLSRCQQCVNQMRCSRLDDIDKHCCQIDCYTLKHCKQSTSEECTNSPVECAMGDAYRYTIQPNFRSFNEFECHLRHRPPKILYTLFYHIKVPGPYGAASELETPRVYQTVYADDHEFQGHGELQAEYLSVEHSAGLNLHDEFILYGQQAQDTRRMNYSVYSLKSPDEFSKEKIVAHKYASNVFVATAQFSKPFAYSTSSWVRDSDCDKDISKFRSKQRYYHDDGQPVNTVIHTVDEPFRYQFKSVDSPPFIRFMVPGNTSVLPWYFKEDGPQLITNQSLTVELNLIGDDRIWTINIMGELTDCPGYIGISILDLMEEEELFQYDALIFCPRNFTLLFHVPNRGRRSDRTFDVRLTDAVHTHHVYLTHMLFETPFHRGRSVEHRDDTASESTWLMVTIGVAGSCSILFFLNLTYAHLEYTRLDASEKKRHRKVTHHCSHRFTSHKLTHRQYVFVISYVGFRVLYSVIFTFTVFLSILGFVLQNDILQLSSLREFQRRKHNESRTLAHDVERFGRVELLRQAELVADMQGACSNYVEELFDSMMLQADNITLNVHHQHMHGTSTSISSLMNLWYQARSEKYKKTMTSFTESYRMKFNRDISPSLRLYQRYLANVYNNDWFQFPQLLYNNSQPSTNGLNTSWLSGREVDFGVFLPVEEIELVQLWTRQWWERYTNDKPPMPKLPQPAVSTDNPQCDDPPHESFLNHSSLSQSVQRVDSSHYMSPQLPAEPTKGPIPNSEQLRREYKYLSPVDNMVEPQHVFSVDDFAVGLHLNIVRFVLIALDIILFIYRCSRTYIAAHSLCEGFEETVMVEEVKGKAVERKNGTKHIASPPAQPMMEKEYQSEYSYPESVTTLAPNVRNNGSAIPNHVPPPSPSATQPVYLAPAWPAARYAGGARYECCFVWQLGMKAVQSGTFCKLAVGVLILVLFTFILEAIMLLLTTDILADMDLFRLYAVGLEVQVNRTNWYVAEQARHFNEVTMAIYRGQMTSELSHLQSMLEYFNIEQDRIVRNYVSEACAVHQSYLGMKPCDISVEAAKLDISMVPCNFIPIQPQFYGGLWKHPSRIHLDGDFAPYLNAVRSILQKSGYAAIVITIFMLVLHVFGIVLFHYLKTRHKFAVHRTYVTAVPEVAISAQTCHQTEGFDNDSEEEVENELRTYSRCARDSPEKRQSLLTANFKSYTETKV